MKQLWYFSAPWCGPCKMFGPTMDRVASQKVFKLIKLMH